MTDKIFKNKCGEQFTLTEMSDMMMCDSQREADKVYDKQSENYDCSMRSKTCFMDHREKMKNIGIESQMWKNNYSSGKSDCFVQKKKSYQPNNKCIGYNCLNTAFQDGFLLQPCSKNIYRNHLECDDNQCCSKSHQLFNNWTKRK